MEKREFKNKVYSLLSQVVKSMANPHRLEIIDLLGQRGRTVEEIANETEISIANASQHLQVLKASNLVEVEREGNYIRYHLANDKIFKTWSIVREVGFERVAEIDKLIQDYRYKKNVLEAITIDELVTRMKSKNTVLLDIRPTEEFNTGHIPGALSIPLETLATIIKTLPKNKVYLCSQLKILAYILTFYVLFCTVVPCTLFDKCEEQEQTTQSSKSNPSKDCNNCSPFSICASCHGFTINYECVNLIPLEFPFKQSYNNYYFSSKSEYYFSFFQPPRTIAIPAHMG